MHIQINGVLYNITSSIKWTYNYVTIDQSVLSVSDIQLHSNPIIYTRTVCIGHLEICIDPSV